MSTPALKVAHVALSLDVGGLERNIVNQIRQAPALDQQISVICLERPGTLAPTAESLGARVVCVHKKPGLRPQIALRLRSILRDLQPDVIHTHQIGPLFYTRLAACGLATPLIVHTEHGKEPYPSSRKLRLLARFAARRAQIFYCLTQDMADHVLASRIVAPNRVRVIHNGIDFSSYITPQDTRAVRDSLGIPCDAPVIGTIGRLTEIKRQDVLIRAFAAVREKLPAAHLLLVGDGPLLTELRALAESLNVAPFVHFAGYQQRTAPYLQAMNVFALTSRSEGMPQALLESCIAAIPVIASRVGGIPEVIDHRHTGLLCEPGDAAALAAGILDLFDQPDRARSFAAAAKTRVQAVFDIARMAREYHDHFLQLLPPRQLAT